MLCVSRMCVCVDKYNSRDANTFLSDYRDAGITPAVTTITVSGAKPLSTFPSVLPPLRLLGVAPGTVTLMQTLLHKYTGKIGPYMHIYLAVFPFKLAPFP